MKVKIIEAMEKLPEEYKKCRARVGEHKFNGSCFHTVVAVCKELPMIQFYEGSWHPLDLKYIRI